ncbi:hypothetical protein HY494_02300 [Candidatus Woesearchaeota archaeon]|nr:hypothetical protein [Candidatus Woesearchaeota archaeon]
MDRILYGAPESEREEENNLVARLNGKYSVQYFNEFLGFAFEMFRCKNSLLLPKKYNLVIYDTKTYGEDWLPTVRADCFKETITRYFVRKETPIIILVDEEVKGMIESGITGSHLHYLAQPYSIDKVAAKVDSLLSKPRRKKNHKNN